MNYKETIEFLFNSLPMYQREGKAAYKANLDNTHRLDEHLAHPHRKFQTIHVAGTNGKGSVSHMLASVFIKAGYKTGLYTSPHLLDYRERIRINGKPIPKKEVTRFVNGNQDFIRSMTPSFFEMSVALAFDYFAREEVEIAIIETGMGGRLDSTNILNPILTIITNISMDHSQFLGDTPAAIAAEKGGIIKEGIPLVLGATSGDSLEVLLGMAKEKAAPAKLAIQTFPPLFQTLNPEGFANFTHRNVAEDLVETYPCDLTGSYQKENISTTLTALKLLKEKGWNLPQSSILEGLRSVSPTTGILGRWQTLDANPRSVCDTAHNSAGISAVVKQIKQTPWQKLHMVWGMVNDKEIKTILPLLPKEANYYFTPSSVPRTMDAKILQSEASKYGLKGEVYPSVVEAYQNAQKKATAKDLIFTGGSTFVVADLLESLGY